MFGCFSQDRPVRRNDRILSRATTPRVWKQRNTIIAILRDKKQRN